MRDGFGTYHYSANETYTGQWHNGQKEGKGRKTWSDGAVFEGNYTDGMLQGEDKITYADGSKSEGIFKDGNSSGKWIYTKTDGTTQERFYKSPGVYVIYLEKDVAEPKTRFNDDTLYKEWWDQTYGKGETKIPNMNIPQATYRVGQQSEAERHRKAMDQISRETTRQMERSFTY